MNSDLISSAKFRNRFVGLVPPDLLRAREEAETTICSDGLSASKLKLSAVKGDVFCTSNTMGTKTTGWREWSCFTHDWNLSTTLSGAEGRSPICACNARSSFDSASRVPLPDELEVELPLSDEDDEEEDDDEEPADWSAFRANQGAVGTNGISNTLCEATICEVVDPVPPIDLEVDGEEMCMGRKEDCLEECEGTDKVSALKEADEDEEDEPEEDAMEVEATPTFASSQVTRRDTLCMRLISLIRFASSSSSGVLLSNRADLFGAAFLEEMMDS